MMDKFIELLKESVILQATLTTMIWGVIVYLIIVGRPVDDVLLSAGSTVLGFYFGTKAQVFAYKINRDIRKGEKE